jgi:hypothetical protein
MKQAMRNRQRDLFETKDPPPPLPSDRREKVLQLVQALLRETMMVDTASVMEDGHDQDHA